VRPFAGQHGVVPRVAVEVGKRLGQVGIEVAVGIHGRQPACSAAAGEGRGWVTKPRTGLQSPCNPKYSRIFGSRPGGGSNNSSSTPSGASTIA
jgi:hypothetical protein